MSPRPIKRIAFFAFPGLTLLDLIGAYDSLRRVALMGIDPEVTHVSSALDLGLYLVERFWGATARGHIAQQMEYRAYDLGRSRAGGRSGSRPRGRRRAGRSTRPSTR